MGCAAWRPVIRSTRGRFEGDPHSRDSAYHQGTVWPWLMGPFITAYLEVHGRTDHARVHAAQWLEPFLTHMQESGLGQISEVADGNAPHRTGGSMAQAGRIAHFVRT